MLPLYLGSLALGGVLIVASIVLGDADTDADVDFDADVDADFGGGLDGDQDALLILKDPSDAMADAGTWLPFFSLRFWTFALATFGASGLLLHLLGVSGFLAAGVSICLGGTIGTGAAWIFRQLQMTETTGNVRMLEVAGTEATVLLAVSKDKAGKVRVVIDGQHVDMPARTQSGAVINRNEKALVVHVDEGVALITPVPLGYKSIRKED
jgi:hypothetical protein